MKKHLLSTLLLCAALAAFTQTENDSIVALDELIVAGKRPTSKITDTGLIYDLQADKATRAMSLLEALRRVPMVTVSADDEIRVNGSSSYAIYLNGRPYRVAQSDPKAVLQSIPANTIAKIELITELDGRYDADAGDAIINIITAKNALDGYALTLNGRLELKPEHDRVADLATEGVSLVAAKGSVNMMLGYEHAWQSVVNQPMTNTFKFLNAEGDAIRETSIRSMGVDGNFNNHTGRVMLEWLADSLNSVYVDGHALFKTDRNNALSQTTERMQGGDPRLLYNRSTACSASGTAEANAIYRNYYRGRPDMCRFSLGYRFALDPEKASSDFAVSDNEAGIEAARTLNKVNGHMAEHTVSADYALPIANGHVLRFGAKDIIRIGKTRPNYFYWENGESMPVVGDAGSYDGAMDYDQNITAIYAAYSGAVKKFNLSASVRGEYSHNAFNLKDEDKHFSYNCFGLIPRLSIAYSRSASMRYSLTYSESVARPGILQLDPFRNVYYSNFMQQGNPDLRQSRTRSLGLSMLKIGQKLTLQASASAGRCADPIVNYFACDATKGSVTMTSINFDRRDFLGQSLYVGYKPSNWASFALSASATENWYRDKALDKRSFGIDWNLYIGADFSLPQSWNLGAQLMCNRQFDDPYLIKKNAMVTPAFFANKSCLDGRLSIGLVVCSPFAKYSLYRTEVDTPQFTKSQRNDILIRSVMVKAAYRLSGGRKKASLDRETSLRNEDLSTGVQ